MVHQALPCTSTIVEDITRRIIVVVCTRETIRHELIDGSAAPVIWSGGGTERCKERQELEKNESVLKEWIEHQHCSGVVLEGKRMWKTGG